jgi:hypothetical protein
VSQEDVESGSPPESINVLHGNGPKATAYRVHDTTAAVTPGTAALLLSGPE